LTARFPLAATLAAGLALAACTSSPPPVDASSPRARAAAAAARAEGDAADGRLRDALDGYQEAVRLAPDDERYGMRAREIRAVFVDSIRGEAESALGKRDFPAARRAALALLEVESGSPAGYHVLAAAAESEGKLEDAWTAAQKARAESPSDPVMTEALARLAMKTSRFAEAESLYASLAESDPSMREAESAARLEFQIQNLPPIAQKAAASPRLTRAQLASLLAAVVPEVGGARVPPGAEVATDALDRPELAALVRVIALGFMQVSRETHRVGADTAVTRAEMAAHLRRLGALLKVQDDGCLASPAALATCGILPDSTTRQLSGREAFAAIDATLWLAR
jgi:hypothetical protein